MDTHDDSHFDSHDDDEDHGGVSDSDSDEAAEEAELRALEAYFTSMGSSTADATATVARLYVRGLVLPLNAGHARKDSGSSRSGSSADSSRPSSGEVHTRVCVRALLRLPSFAA